MDKHLKVWRTHRALGCLYAALAVVMLALLVSLGREAGLIGMYLLAALLGGLATLHLVVAKGAREGKPGARVASMIIAVLMLPAFPLGTIIGIYLLVNSASPWDPVIVAHATR